MPGKRRGRHFWIRLLLAIGFLLITGAEAQVHVAISDFTNRSNLPLLDAWEKNAPELLSTELSQYPDVVVLERRRLQDILQEQQLALGGFLQDSALVKQIGHLMGAEVILSGAIHKFGHRYRIDLKIVRVRTGEVWTEKAVSPDSRHLNRMIEMLAANVHYRLTGQGKYVSRIKIGRYHTGYWLMAAGALFAGAIYTDDVYKTNRRLYQNNTDLTKFQTYYDRANGAYKATVLLGTLTASAVVGALVAWVKNRTAGEIKAGSGNNPTTGASVQLYNKGVSLGVQVRW
ncbi:MAG TPA: hypothetical protein ENJ89_08550 [Caldithrix abyssi]|uniref:FlgO domain-containing protein n=1 Tax=Caldithrix abyssi TaxID=187145 RepID=A0A7V5PQ61_CALAY|nr:hypothetical protein [Caldithrix abyssi]